jgi:hypothetical protein
MLAKIPSRGTQTVVSALIKQAKKLPDKLYKSLTSDRKKLTDHKCFTMATNFALHLRFHGARGSAAPTRTPIDCYDSTSLRERTHRCTVRLGYHKGTQRAPSHDARLPVAGRTISGLCCVDRLS